MEQEKRYIAIDRGAESRRVMLGTVRGKNTGLVVVYLFSNGPVENEGVLGKLSEDVTAQQILEKIGN